MFPLRNQINADLGVDFTSTPESFTGIPTRVEWGREARQRVPLRPRNDDLRGHVPAGEEHRAVNLGQGFPDEGFPLDVLERAAAETVHGWNQYPSMMGVPELRQAVAEHGRRFYGLDVDWAARDDGDLRCHRSPGRCLLGLIEPGDEVVVFQPLYDCYLPMIRRGGGVPRFVNLHPRTGASIRTSCGRPSRRARSWCWSTTREPGGEGWSATS